MEYLDLTTLFILVIVFLISWKTTQRIYAFNFFNRLGIPGPKPHFIYGNVHQLLRCEDPLKTLKEWQKKYGKVFGYFEGSRPAYIISDPELVKEICVKEFSNFTDRPKIFSPGEPFDRLLNLASGDVWKRIRSTLSPAFTGIKLKEMSRITNESLQIYIDLMSAKAKAKESFNIYQTLYALTCQMVADSVFALKVDCQRDPNDKFYKFFNDYRNSFAQSRRIENTLIFPTISNFLIKISYYLGFGSNMKSMQWLLDIVRNLVNKRRVSQNKRIDMMQLMIDAVDNSKDSSSETWNIKKGLSTMELEINAFLFLIAGIDTTVNALGFIIHTLIIYPEAQKAVQEEIDQHIHTKIAVYEDVQDLSYLDQVISEALRLYPLVTIFLNRETSEDKVIRGIYFKKGMAVNMSPYLLHHDEDYWTDPEAFVPERFSLHNKSNITPFTYLAFGNGPRNCIGQRLAFLDMKIILATLLKNFTVKKGDMFEDKLSFDNYVTVIRPRNGVSVKIVPRNA